MLPQLHQGILQSTDLKTNRKVAAIDSNLGKVESGEIITEFKKKKKYFISIKVNCNNNLQLLKKNVASEDYRL